MLSDRQIKGVDAVDLAYSHGGVSKVLVSSFAAPVVGARNVSPPRTEADGRQPGPQNCNTSASSRDLPGEIPCETRKGIKRAHDEGRLLGDHLVEILTFLHHLQNGVNFVSTEAKAFVVLRLISRNEQSQLARCNDWKCMLETHSPQSIGCHAST